MKSLTSPLMAIEVTARSAATQRIMAGITFAQHDLTKIVEYCDNATEINNDNFFAHYYLAGALKQTGDQSPEKSKRFSVMLFGGGIISTSVHRKAQPLSKRSPGAEDHRPLNKRLHPIVGFAAHR